MERYRDLTLTWLTAAVRDEFTPASTEHAPPPHLLSLQCLSSLYKSWHPISVCLINVPAWETGTLLGFLMSKPSLKNTVLQMQIADHAFSFRPRCSQNKTWKCSVLRKFAVLSTSSKLVFEASYQPNILNIYTLNVVTYGSFKTHF